MNTKSGRFEMRLDEETLARIDNWRRDEDDIPSRSEAVRRLVDSALAAKQDRNPKLSDGERLIVLMLADFSKKLKLDGGFDPDFLESTIIGGHYWGLRWRYGGIFDDHKEDPRIVSEVVEILDMWSFLESGFKNLSAEEKERIEIEAPYSHKATFPGFDGNHESEHLSVAVYLMEKLDRFPSLKRRANVNSHHPTLVGYRRMLSVFLPMRATLTGGELSASQIINILKARRVPDSAPFSDTD